MRKLKGTRLVLSLIAATLFFAGRANAQGLVLSPGDSQVVTQSLLTGGDGRDGFVEVGFVGFSFPYFGETYTTLYVQINGCISFGGGFTVADPTTADFVASSAYPTIAPLWSDFDLSGESSFDPSQAGGGSITLALSNDGNEFTVTWQDIPYEGSPGTNTFAATIRSDGTIVFNYVTVADRAVTSSERWIVGVSPGGETPGVPGGVDTPSVILDLTPPAGPFTYGGAAAKYDFYGAEAGTAAPTFLGGSTITFVPQKAAEVAGYYDMVDQQGDPAQEPPIVTAGLEARNLTDLTVTDLNGVDVLFVQNPNNRGYGAEYVSRLADIEAAVNAGMVLIVHDRRVTEAAAMIPGGAGIAFTRSPGVDIDISTPGTLVTDGPGGTLDDTSLDGGTYSYHGYAALATLPQGAVPLLNTGDPDHVVTFAYPYGEGWVIYSSIPLDYYLFGGGGGVPFNFREIYAPNVIAYAASLFGSGVSAANQPPDAHNMILLVREDEPAVAQFSAEDPDGDPLTFRIVTNGTKGTVKMLDVETGEYEYTPSPDVSGTDIFRYKAVDPDGASDTATVIVLIRATNDAPTAEPVELTTGKGTALEGYLLGTDPEGAPLEFKIFLNGTLGTAEILDSGTGFFRYTPNPDATGTDTFWFTVSDGSLTSTPVPVVITIAPRESASTSDGTTGSGDDSSRFGCFIRTLTF